MNSRFDRVMQDIAIQSAKNGGPGIPEVLRAIQASHEDSVADARKLAKMIGDVAKELKVDVAAAAKQRRVEIADSARVIKEQRDKEIGRLEFDIDNIKDNCEALHSREARRQGDPDTENWGNSFGSEQGKQVWLMWLLGTAVGRVLLVVAGAAGVILLNLFVYGRP